MSIDNSSNSNMKAISLAQLMKLKNRYEERILECRQIVNTFNSTVAGSDTPNVRTAFENHLLLTKRLIVLKTKLDEANRGFQRQRLFEISEKKGLLLWMKGLDTTHGKKPFATNDDAYYKAEIRLEEKAQICSELDDEIFRLQEEIDTFNASTSVWVPTEFDSLTATTV